MKTHIQLNDEFKIAKLEKRVKQLEGELLEASIMLISDNVDSLELGMCKRMNTHFAEMESKREQEYRKIGYIKKIIGVSHHPGVNNLIDVHAYFHDESKEPDKILERKLKDVSRNFYLAVAALAAMGFYFLSSGLGVI